MGVEVEQRDLKKNHGKIFFHFDRIKESMAKKEMMVPGKTCKTKYHCLAKLVLKKRKMRIDSRN